MIILIAGIFFGVLAIATVGHNTLGVVLFGAAAILFIAAGIRQLVAGRADDIPTTDDILRRTKENAARNPVSAEDLRRMQEAQRKSTASAKARNPRQPKKD